MRGHPRLLPPDAAEGGGSGPSPDCRGAIYALLRPPAAGNLAARVRLPSGDDEILREYGIRFFFTDAHGILHASPRPKYGVFAPVYCPSGVAAFGRDLESSKQVWSAQEGYPGDPYYREFYRDIGYDLEYDYIRPYIHPSGLRVHTGIKYHRITGKTADKQPYIPWIARERAAVHAGNFMFNREKQIEYLVEIMDRRPIVVSPYDAELFGHWWFEGPQWLDFLLRKIAYDQQNIELISPIDYLAIYPRNQVSTPPNPPGVTRATTKFGWRGATTGSTATCTRPPSA